MTWQAYRVVLRLRSSLHIGQMKLGNVQRTRPYVTGRALWGALTERLTRDGASGPATDSDLYREVGDVVHDTLAFTYLYPTTHADGMIDLWPWDDGFRARFLSTYASTALSYPQQSAEEGSLHEVECITPHTLDGGQVVYLAGYILAQDGAPDWQSALSRLQFGGERGYGWGWVEPVKIDALNVPPPQPGYALFGGLYMLEPDTWPPVLVAQDNRETHSVPLLAHTLAVDSSGRQAISGVNGVVEPLVGRETAPDGRFGIQVSQARICYAPGSQVTAATTFRITAYGLWELA